MSDINLPNVETFHYTTSQKITFVNMTPDLIRKISMGKLSAFSATRILAQQFACYHWQRILPAVFLDVTGSIHCEGTGYQTPKSE